MEVTSEQSPVAPEGAFLSLLFSRLGDAGICYAVMRNYSALPDSLLGSDLDLIVAPEDFAALDNILRTALADSGGVVFGQTCVPGFRKVCAFGCSQESRMEWWGVCIDINVGLHFRGYRLDVDSNWPVEDLRGVRVIPSSLAAVLGILKEALNNGMCPERYLADARIISQEEWRTIEAKLAPMGLHALSCIWRLIFAADAVEARALCRELQMALWKNAILSHPGEVLKGRLLSFLSKLRRYLRPEGKMIAFLGVDGAGKSTIIREISPVLMQATHSPVIVHHLRPNFLPPLAALRIGAKKDESASEVVQNPHASRPSGGFISVIRAFYLTANYVLGYWFCLRVALARKPNFIIFDRYAYDMVVDPARFRISLPSWITSIFVSLAPKPDVVFCLIGSPYEIAGRKNELPVEEIARQVEVLKSMAKGISCAHIVSVDQGVASTRQQVLCVLRSAISR